VLSCTLPDMLVAASVASAAAVDAAAPPATVATAGGAQARGGWMPFVQQGGSTGVNFASQGADTALHFFTDPNFDFQKEGQKYQQLSGETGNAFGGLSQGMLPQQAAPQQAAPAGTAPEAPAATSLAGPQPASQDGIPMGSWQDFMNMGIHTGIAYAGAGADTATEWGNGKGDGAATANKFGALSQTTGNNFNTLSGGTPAAPTTTPAAAAAPAEKSAEATPAAEGAKPRGGWMPFAQQGAATGAGFGAQGMDTAFRFFTDPNFDFQKEGQAYQASGAATGNAFGGLSQGMLPQQQQAAAAPPEAATAPEASAMRAASQPVRKHLVLGPFSMGLVVLAVAAAVVGAIRARARAVWVKGLKYARQVNADEFV